MRTIVNLHVGLHSLPVALGLRRSGVDVAAIIAARDVIEIYRRELASDLAGALVIDREHARQAQYDGVGYAEVGWPLVGDRSFVAGLGMLDRVNWNSANFSDLYRLYTRHLEWARKLIRDAEAEVCWFDGIPHQAHDWALYQACMEAEIRILMPRYVVFDHSKVLHSSLNGGAIRVGKLVPGAFVSGFSHSDYLSENIGFQVSTKESHKQRGISQILGSMSLETLRSKFRIFRETRFVYTSMVPSWRHFEITKDLVKLRDRYRHSLVSKRLLELPREIDLNGRDIAFFPLHYQPEANSLPGGLAHFDQISAIRALASRLPDNMVLVVKEHPQMLKWRGQWARARSASFYEELQRIPKVKFVSPEMPSAEILARSVLVATLTGTAGYEARLSGKSALVFGSAWYENFRGVHRARTLEDVDRAIAAGLSGKDTALEPDEIREFQEEYTMVGFGKNIPRPVGESDDFWALKYASGLASVIRKLRDEESVST